MSSDNTSGSPDDATTLLLVGIGSDQGDDRIGWIVADRLEEICGLNVRIRTTAAPLDLLNWIDETHRLHIVDACEGDGTPGALRRWSWCVAPENDACADAKFVPRRSGTHDFDVISVLQLAQRLGRLPPSVTIWGVQGERFEPSAPLSPAIESVLPDIVETIAKELTDARTLSGSLAADAG